MTEGREERSEERQSHRDDRRGGAEERRTIATAPQAREGGDERERDGRKGNPGPGFAEV